MTVFMARHTTTYYILTYKPNTKLIDLSLVGLISKVIDK